MAWISDPGEKSQRGARSTSSWLRRDDAPSVMDSMESSSSIWSMRILAESAISASVASASMA
ncbi:hypothetical protein GR254_15875 [Mycobacterium tuberculosis]|nr:hypothetical protein [Mycobacterium tuberculosis]